MVKLVLAGSLWHSKRYCSKVYVVPFKWRCIRNYYFSLSRFELSTYWNDISIENIFDPLHDCLLKNIYVKFYFHSEAKAKMYEALSNALLSFEKNERNFLIPMYGFMFKFPTSPNIPTTTDGFFSCFQTESQQPYRVMRAGQPAGISGASRSLATLK